MQSRVATGRLRPSLEGLLRLAEDLGLDGARVRQDMQSDGVSETLARSRGLARAFAFPGTPALVVGRTVVVGLIGPRRLRALVEQEERDAMDTAQNFCG
jgi:predicted DsbA family dithiol-disulfide isomerase